jgi:archaellum component FlaC
MPHKQDSEEEPPAGQVINDDILDYENFEEINESREIVEDRINRLKLQMIDFTVKQYDISEKIASLKKDIELLQTKCDDFSQQ